MKTENKTNFKEFGPIYKMDVTYNTISGDSLWLVIKTIIKNGKYYEASFSGPASHWKSGKESKEFKDYSRTVFYVDVDSAQLIREWVTSNSSQVKENP